MQRYVLGFAFDGAGRVLLIRKNRPAWQAGRWNGVGGKQEPNEFLSRAVMSREFAEETGVLLNLDRWRMVGSMMGGAVDADEGPGWYVTVFAVDLVEADGEPHTTTDEEVCWWLIDDLRTPEVIENVPMLVALCDMPSGPPSYKVPQFSLRY